MVGDFLYYMFWSLVGGLIYLFVMGFIQRWRRKPKVWFGVDLGDDKDMCVITKATEMPDGSTEIEFVDEKGVTLFKQGDGKKDA